MPSSRLLVPRILLLSTACGVMNEARTLAWDARWKTASGRICFQSGEDGSHVVQIDFVQSDAVADISQIVGRGGAVPAGEAVDANVGMFADDVLGQVAAAGAGHAGDDDGFEGAWLHTTFSFPRSA